MFSDAGPDVRWIGNERGVAGETCWSTIDPAAVPYAGYDAPGVGDTLQRGHPNGSVWRPGETDVSIRPGWFWHPAEDGKVRSVDKLMELYFTSVGRNMGRVVERFTVEVGVAGSWTTVDRGTTIGNARLARFPARRAERVRVTVESSLDVPRLSQLSLFLDEAAG